MPLQYYLHHGYKVTVTFRMFYSGNVNDDIAFAYENDAYAYNGCGATLRGQFWYFGGMHNTLRQV